MLVLEDGTTVDGRYDIVGTIGSGGFGSVYKAWQKQFDRTVALKILNTNVLEEADGLARFEREAKAIAGLQHKNIVAFYGYGVWKEAPYMVMELIEGTSLQSRLNKHIRLDALHAAHVMKQVCDGLSCAHANGVIHRDLKPTNIMLEAGLNGRDVVKLIDFGLVKLMPGYGVPNQKLTEAGYAVGTCHYMSPEQCIGGNIDHRSDIYAAAAILYQVVSGERPFDDEDIVKVMAAQINEAPKPLSARLGSSAIVDALQAIVNKGMAKDPEDRYQTVAEMAHDLDSIIRGESGKLAHQGRTSQRLVLPPAAIKQARKKKLRWVAPAVAGLAAAIFFGFQYANKTKPMDDAKVDASELNIYDEMALRDAVPPPVPIPEDVKVALAGMDVGYRRHRIGDCCISADQLLAEAERERFSPYVFQMAALKSAQIYNAAGHEGDAQRTLKKASSLDEQPDPQMRLDLQEALAQAAWLNHRFAVANEIWDGLLVNGPQDRHKRAQLGLARLALWHWDAAAAKGHLEQLEQMMTPEQHSSLTLLMLRIAYAGCTHDREVAAAQVNQLLNRPFEHPDDMYDDHLLNQDVECAQSALMGAGYRDLVKAVQSKTSLFFRDEDLGADKSQH